MDDRFIFVPRKGRGLRDKLFHGAILLATLFGVTALALLVWDVGKLGLMWLDWGFLTSFPSRFPENAGIKSALAGTLWVITITGLTAFPLGVAAAIYLEEFAPKRWWSSLISLNIANLAGVPSIIYGLLGLVLFVRTFGFGRSILAGALTLTLLVLPIIIIASREAIKAVPRATREGSLALGASQWQTVRYHVLPYALPGILTGTILALSRAIGEAAPLILVGGVVFVAYLPEGPLDQGFTVLPIQIFNWASRPQIEFYNVAAAGILVLLVVLILMNTLAIYLRARAGKRMG